MKKLLFALPVVLLLAAGCSSNQPVTENQPNNTQPTQTQQTTPTPTPTPTQTDDYLVIKEWSVEFPKPAGMSDLIYIVGSNDSISFSTKQLTNLASKSPSGENFCDAKHAGIGDLGRADSLPDPDGINYPTNLKIGKYYYYYIHPQSVCSFSDNDKKSSDLQSKQSAALGEAIKKLRSVK